MAYKIIWKDEALYQLDANIRYLEPHWSLREIDNYINKSKGKNDCSRSGNVCFCTGSARIP
jgi:hypothetical protein